ncbi:MAG: DUF3445 domain-containing protein [Verrucomicrobia bacterium]|nr:DUF3445 domain-containing protein [Verrucomicrobiota bacterium]
MKANDVAMLFSGEDFRWQMRFERGEMRSFLAPGPNSEAVLAERWRWLGASPERYMVLTSDGIPLLDEAIDLARENEALSEAQFEMLCAIRDPQERCMELGRIWEADFALLGPTATGSLILSGGVVCFPSSWSLPEKIGKPMQSIHQPVPGLNEAIGRQIDLFLGKLRPGVVWLRFNWGVVRTAELNQHPDRDLPRLTSPVRLDEAFLRIERQALVALPGTRGVLFGIRIEQLSLAEVSKEPAAVKGLVHGLSTMDEEIARYKGFAQVRSEIVELLQTNATGRDSLQ